MNDEQEGIVDSTTEPVTSEVELDSQSSAVARDDQAGEIVMNPEVPAGSAAEPFPVPSFVAQPEQVVAPNPPRKSSRRSVATLVVVGMALIIIVAAICGYLLYRNESSPTSSGTLVTRQLMSGEVSLIDGLAETSTDNKVWKKLAVGDIVREKSYYRTSSDGRLVIALDDGSAIRLNSSTTITIDRLDAKNASIANMAGEVYTRLVKSDRAFTVLVDDTTYRAMGTAYKTLNTAMAKGVEVYESSVKVKNAIDVTEGKYYYEQSADESTEQKTLDISVDKLKQDVFVKWNYDQDKNSSEFKASLGYLKKIDEPTATTTGQTTTKTAASISLKGLKTDTGIQLTWTLNNTSTSKGFKVVKGLSANPSYGKDDAVFVDASAQNYQWKLKDGKMYHFRVCLYSEYGCTLYSNDISVVAPYYSVEEPTGSVLLSQVSGSNFGWTLSGTAPYGFKLVWAATPGPTYPTRSGDEYTYYGDSSTRSGKINETSGTFYVRVCLYTSTHKCEIYSNEVVVTL